MESIMLVNSSALDALLPSILDKAFKEEL